MTAAERFEALFAAYEAGSGEGTYCIGRDAWWPMDLAKAHREACAEAEATARA